MEKILTLTILSAMALMLTSCTKEYKSSALVEASVRNSTNEKIDPLREINLLIEQHDIELPERTKITQLRQSRLLQIQSVAEDPVEAAKRANELAMALEKVSSENAVGNIFKVVDKAVPSTR